MRLVFIFLSLLLIFSCKNKKEEENFGEAVKQISIPRVEAMPNLPEPYKMLNWKEKAEKFDAFAFDFNPKSSLGAMIWLDDNQRNLPQITFGIYTAVKDVRQGAENNNGEFHESLNSLAAILGAGLVGIDKTQQNGYNYVKMVQNYFNSDIGWNIVMNNTSPKVGLLGGGYGRDWWYDVFPNVLFYNVCDVFPNVENADFIQRSIAEKFYKADSILDGNYDYSYFDYGQMKGMVNHIPLQQDAAGGHGYVLYAAYQKYKNPKYLEGAKSAISALNNQTESCFYEILLPVGIYTAARLNAEHNTNFDLAKMLDWVFEGNKNPEGRTGWGIIADTWGKYDVSGLQGSITDGGGYAFLMNGIKTAMALVPMVKYEPAYGKAIGKWMLNNANASRLFFPNEIPNENQWLPELKDLTNGIISYEGLRYEDDYGKPELKDIHPVAIGDGPKWHAKNPKESMFSLYSSAPLGIFGAIISTTDVEMVLKLDCNATDFYADKKFPVFLLYNPYQENKSVTYQTDNNESFDLFDIISKKYVKKSAKGNVKIELSADTACLIVELPSKTKIEQKGNMLIANGTIISYK